MTTDSPLKPLTNKQLAFVEHYLANGSNGAQAALDAGYKETTARSMAHKLLRLPDYAHVQLEIQTRQDEFKEKTGATAEAKRRLLWKSAQLAEKALEEPVLNEQGEIIGTLFNSKVQASMVSAIAELNRMDGDHAAVKHKIDANVQQQIDYKGLLARRRRQLEEKKASVATESPTQ